MKSYFPRTNLVRKKVQNALPKRYYSNGAAENRRFLDSTTMNRTPIVESLAGGIPIYFHPTKLFSAIRKQSSSACHKPPSAIDKNCEFEPVKKQILSASNDESKFNRARTSSTPNLHSELSYRHRLQNGRFSTLLELIKSPYAPSPICVLIDLLEAACLLKSGNSPLASAASSFQSPVPGYCSTEAFLRIQSALSMKTNIQAALSMIVKITKDAVHEYDEVGDAKSAQGFRETLSEVDKLARKVMELQIHTPFDVREGNAPKGQPQVSEWRLPDSVHAEFLHQLIQISSFIGSSSIAIQSLDELIRITESNSSVANRDGSSEPPDTRIGYLVEEDSFSLDTIVVQTGAALQKEIEPTLAEDHIRAIKSCARARNFSVALLLYERFLTHARSGFFPLTNTHLSDALIALSLSVCSAEHYEQLQELIIKTEAVKAIPVSVELYTSLITAVSRAEGNSKMMSIALSLYRRLRDGGLVPVADTYAALIRCCAVKKEPTHAFAFYHEAIAICKTSQLSPEIYTNLLFAYTNAGWGRDAKSMLEVLVEAGAPLTRAAFHCVMEGAVTLREAMEVKELMTKHYKIAPSPQTYAHLVRASTKSGTSGLRSILELYDLHLESLRSFSSADAISAITVTPLRSRSLSSSHSSDGTAHRNVGGVESQLEGKLIREYPSYVEALEEALMKTSIDPLQDPHLMPYLRPMARICQQKMNAYTEQQPQCPTKIPPHTLVAVLAPDVLANLDELFVPFASYYSVIVIPYSSIFHLQKFASDVAAINGEKRLNSTDTLLDASLLEYPTPITREALAKKWRQQLVKFLHSNRETVHLVSLEEELNLAKDLKRYGVSASDSAARSAAFALHLSRFSATSSSKNAQIHLYAENKCNVVLVSSDYANCGRYVVDLRKSLLGREASTLPLPGGLDTQLSMSYPQKKAHSTRNPQSHREGLIESIRRVYYHNPQTNPTWAPPKVSVDTLRIRDDTF